MKRCSLYFLLVLLFCSHTFAQELTLDKAKEIAKKVTKEFESTLKKELKKAKRENGIDSMAEYCIKDSKKVALNLNKKYAPKISIKRISLNNRNEKMGASDGEQDILKAFDLLAKANSYLPEQIVQIVEEGEYKIYSPIQVRSRDCKKCHGLEVKVDQKLKEKFFNHYKNNKAYGYKSADVRGAIVVSISE